MSIVLKGSFYCFLACLLSCSEKAKRTEIPMPSSSARDTASLSISTEEWEDRIRGAIVGSAIGDAMGAPTEMWNRADILAKYGYITGLSTALREKSAEGTWRHNMVAGSTTDDTRWKMLMGDYLEEYRGRMSAEHFATFIASFYQDRVKELSDVTAQQSTDLLDDRMEQLNWIKEWARVAIAFQQGTVPFMEAQHRFYGGEMACAGMLYAPMFGLVASSCEEAYSIAVEHALFDLGYARDITGLVAALTHKALHTSAIDSLLDIHQYIDPLAYRDARLVGRISVQILKDSRSMVDQAFSMTGDTASIAIPENFPGDRRDWLEQQYLYSELEKRQRFIPFHAGEIWQILCTGLLYGGGDFQKTMSFIVNYGRDNDTVAAVAGMILGAAIGYEQLPEKLKKQTLIVSKEVVGLDLDKLAHKTAASLR